MEISLRVDNLLFDAFVTEGPPASIIEGRAPAAAGEVALDPRTLDRLGKGLGDARRDWRDSERLLVKPFGPDQLLAAVDAAITPV